MFNNNKNITYLTLGIDILSGIIVIKLFKFSQ